MTDTHTYSVAEALASRPRVGLGHFPTPLEEAPRLSERLGVRILIKRDDQTGLALGGNKVRKLEFLLADACSRGADIIITTGGSQSNHARLTAAACTRIGLECRLVLDRGLHPEAQGNLLLDRLFGADVRLIESADPAVATEEMLLLAQDLEAQGRRPYIIPRGGSIPPGATGYVAMVAELLTQLATLDVRPTHLYLGTGSCGTHAGTLTGVTASGSGLIVQGISVSRPEELQREKVKQLAGGTLAYLSLPGSIDPDRILVDDGHRGPGYGIPTDATLEAIRVGAEDEALILDPVYTGKAMAGLIAHAREGRLTAKDTVIFVHTGGAPALFAYSEEVAAALPASA